MRGSAAFRASVAPGGALAGPWVKNELWRRARAVPSLDLQFADRKSLVDATTGANLVTFTRASSGTYVDSQGVIKTATTNLLTYSEQFDNAAWSVARCTISANTTTSPDGATTADTIVEDTTSNSHPVYRTVAGLANATAYTASVYIKASARSKARIALANTAFAANVYVDFDLTAVTATASNATGTIVAVGNGWYRCTATATTVAAASGDIYIQPLNAAGAASYLGTGVNALFIWGAQLEQSSTVGEYIPTTSTINSAPRFDHNPTTGESLGLLVEEQRTNSIRNNTMVGAVAGTPGTLPTNWVQSNNTGLAANVIGTGTENGINYIDLRINGTTTGTGQTNILFETNTGIAALTGQTWTFAPYIKVQAGSTANFTNIRLVIQENTSAGNGVAAGSLEMTIPNTPLGSYRPAFTRTLSGGATVAAILPYIQCNINTGLAIDITLRIGLPQLEQGAFATSVIPTTTATVTRSADVASISGSNFSSWYRQDEGTFAQEFAKSYAGNFSGYPHTGSASDGTTNNSIRLGYGTIGSQAVVPDVLVSGINQINYVQGVLSGVSFAKSALAVASNNIQFAFNGVAAAADTSCSLPTVNQFIFGRDGIAGGNPWTGYIKRLTYWPTRLPNSTLQSITT